jgi:hypothetical protein
MEVGYQETLEQLTGMFEGFDQETIKSVLAANGFLIFQPP